MTKVKKIVTDPFILITGWLVLLGYFAIMRHDLLLWGITAFLEVCTIVVVVYVGNED